MAGVARHLNVAVRATLRPVLFAGMAGLVAVITLQVVSRVFFTAVSWTEEVARFLLIWLTFVGATLALAEGRHIAVTVLADRLPPRARRAVAAIGLLACIAFLAALAWIGWQYMNMQSFQKSAALRLPMIYVYAIIPISGALMALICLGDLIAVLRGKGEGGAE